MRTLRVLRTDREDPAQGGIGNDVVLVGKKSWIETGLTNHIFGIGSQFTQDRNDLLCDPDPNCACHRGMALGWMR